MSQIQPVLLCGGVGSKLYPLSTPEMPKPFLNLISERSMLQETALRVKDMKPPVVSCHVSHREMVERHLRGVHITPEIIPETVRRNTGPAVAAVADRFREQPDEILLFLPCDHVIADQGAFIDVLDLAFNYLDQNKLFLFGAKPDGAETGYGYIETDSPAHTIHRVKSFHEKPDTAQAERYVRRGYFWNTGMVMARAGALNKAISYYAPTLLTSGESISFDHAVLERAQHLMLVPTDMGWCDIGNHERLQAHRQVRTSHAG